MQVCREDEGIRREIIKLRSTGRGMCVKGEGMDGERFKGWSLKISNQVKVKR